MQWHQLDRMQTICTSRQTPTPHNSFFTDRMLFLTPNQRCQSIEHAIYGNYFTTDSMGNAKIAGLDIAELDIDGRMCEQLTELKLQNFINFLFDF